jgi:hypothetical protein
MAGTQQLVAIPATIPSTLPSSTSSVVQCPTCNGQGGMGRFGPCNPSAPHVTHLCPTCNGRAVITVQYVTPTPNTVTGAVAAAPLAAPGTSALTAASLQRLPSAAPSAPHAAPHVAPLGPPPVPVTTSIAPDSMTRFANQPLIVRNAHRCNLRVNDTGMMYHTTPHVFIVINGIVLTNRLA